ncbi:MAG: hypothetical protein ACYDH1_12210 [Anaerolineaceae bacterium]
MSDKSDIRRIWVFMLIAFTIAWLTALVIAFIGGIANSPLIFPRLGLKLATLPIVAVSMFAPTLAHIFTRIITDEGSTHTWLRPHSKLYWPAIVMGYNFGLNYAGFPVFGILAMVWLSIGLSSILNWAVLCAHSVWPAVIGHVILNGLGGIGILFAVGEINLLFGPSSAGIIGSIAFTLFALWVFLDSSALPPRMKLRKSSENNNLLGLEDK